MKTIAFACVHNAGRSQMAAVLAAAAADRAQLRVISAGTQPAAGVHPEVVEVMREVGFDLGAVVPQKLTPELVSGTSVLVTLGCGEECPVVPGARREDWPLADPKGQGIQNARSLRGQLSDRVRDLFRREGLPLDRWVELRAIQDDDLERVRALWREYQAVIGGQVCFQGFEGELAALPQPYGSLLVAEHSTGIIGCVAVKLVAPQIAEMKRLYVQPAYEGWGLGRRLVVAAIAAARSLGAKELTLDTLHSMTRAHALYRRLGFRAVEVPAGAPADRLYFARSVA